MRLTSITIAGLAAVAWHYAPRPTVPHEMAIVSRDFAFDAPDSVAAGMTTIHLHNNGPDLHHVMLVRLGAGHTVADFGKAMAAAGPPPAWATFVGGPNSPAPGGDATATVDLAPGQYVILCVIPASDGVLHFMKGMVRPLTVTGTYRAAALPAADIDMALVDYGFELSHPLSAGRHVIRVHNAAAQLHEVAMARLAPGKSATDLITWIDTRNGPPPGMPIGGVTPIGPYGELLVQVDLTPGEYALICFVPDAHDGKPHLVHGMVRQITVGPSGT